VEKTRISPLAVTLFIGIGILAIVGVTLRVLSNDFGNLFLPPTTVHSGGIVYEIIATLLIIATDILYLLGGGVVFFGSMITLVRFVKVKAHDPFKPSGVTRHFSGYLTLSLELFIGAEIIKTTTTQELADFEVLILIILSRGLFSLILYLERKWHGSDTETE
jgi:uncharacterized membrane protein